MRTQDLFSPCNLMATMNYLVDNKADYTTFADMTGAERTWLRIGCREEDMTVSGVVLLLHLMELLLC
jgi:hypothetical protein